MPQEPIVEHPVITFSPSVSTKSFITSTDDPVFKQGFSVFARKTELPDPVAPQAALNSIEMMKNYKVKYDDSKLGWSYLIAEMPNQSEVYWGMNCKHRFLAIFPYDPDGTHFTPESGQYKREYVTTVNERGINIADDFMYARHEQDWHIGEKVTPVVLQMTHAFSGITVKVRNASENSIENITGISLNGLQTNIQSLTVDRESEEPAVLVLAPEVGEYNFPNTGGDANKPFIPMGNPDSYPIFEKTIILPQSFLTKDVWLTFSVKFDVEGQAAKVLSYKISSVPLAGPVADQYRYLPGKHYIYKIDILNDYLNCTVDVVDWIEDKPIELK